MFSLYRKTLILLKIHQDPHVFLESIQIDLVAYKASNTKIKIFNLTQKPAHI